MMFARLLFTFFFLLPYRCVRGFFYRAVPMYEYRGKLYTETFDIGPSQTVVRNQAVGFFCKDMKSGQYLINPYVQRCPIGASVCGPDYDQSLGTCAKYAGCHTIGTDKRVCSCMPGYFGNGYVQCFKHCDTDLDCPSPYAECRRDGSEKFKRCKCKAGCPGDGVICKPDNICTESEESGETHRKCLQTGIHDKTYVCDEGYYLDTHYRCAEIASLDDDKKVSLIALDYEDGSRIDIGKCFSIEINKENGQSYFYQMNSGDPIVVNKKIATQPQLFLTFEVKANDIIAFAVVDGDTSRLTKLFTISNGLRGCKIDSHPKIASSEDDTDVPQTKPTNRRKKFKVSSSQFVDSLPNSPWFNRTIPVLLKVVSGHDESSSGAYKGCTKDKLLQMHKSGQNIEECVLRDMATVLSNVVTSIDEWRENAQNAMSQRITIEEARSILDDFKELTGGLIKVDLATEIENEIKSCETFGAKVLMIMTTLSSNSERTVSLDDVESLVQEAQGRRFLVPEVAALQSIFRNLISIRSLMEMSVLELDISECESLVSICEKGIVRLPRLDELRRRLQESVWLHNAGKVCQRPVKYSLAKNLIDTVPEVLREHRLFGIVKQKCLDVEKWLERVSQFSFYQMILNDTPNNGVLSKKDVVTTSSIESGTSKGGKCDARTFEEICSAYHQLELTLPIYRNIEPLYQSLKRLQRRLNKIEALLNSNSRNPNVATDCLLLLQHSEPLSVFIDLTQQLQPIRSGVELWLSYEKKCRRVLDSVKSFSISADFNRLKTDWGFLLNFRKTTKLSDADFACLMDLMKAYNEEERVPFEEVRQLEAEFGSLRIKNLVLQREMNEIYEKGQNMISKIQSVLDNVKEDGGKSDSVLSHLVLIILEVLKFGAKLDFMHTLMLCLDYLRWSREFYAAVLSDTALSDGGSRVKALAVKGASETFKEITVCNSVHERILARINEIGCVPASVAAPLTEFELLGLLLS
ncbi:uncharacterized protein BXIN_1022 [Babesia sp. Xinjiang]|uniref:uncharacterized protein n=1 Tax=Babesia sp. Xinjiang TaxID=462227 RepID=UPI000A2531CE|nr:uncharacterized protein BXIN_1022 [Babesia sp. Xinjiang]ORM42021.1 hypothetical protein BXIN_1022 [Babesia sp. Xinjiang]